MNETPTRDEFTGMCNALESATRDHVISMASGERDDRREIERLLDDLHDAWDTLENRIAELEEMTPESGLDYDDEEATDETES